MHSTPTPPPILCILTILPGRPCTRPPAHPHAYYHTTILPYYHTTHPYASYRARSPLQSRGQSMIRPQERAPKLGTRTPGPC
eukprot:4788577-Prymnesium_polylepis.1